MYDQELKRKLRNILAHNNLSMNQLAKDLGVSEGTVRKLLNEDIELPASAKIISYLCELNLFEELSQENNVRMDNDSTYVFRDVSFAELFHYLRNLEADHFDLIIAEDNLVSIIPKKTFTIDDHR